MGIIRVRPRINPRNGLVEYWEMDATSGNEAGVLATHTLAANNAPTSGAGFVGTARVLNGTTQSFTIASGSATAFNPGTSNFTIRIRVNPNTLPAAEKDMFSKNLTTGNQRGWILLRTSAGIVRFAVSTDGIATAAADSPVVMATGQWYDIFAGVDHGAGKVWISVDCEPVVTAAFTAGVVFASEAALGVGVGQGGAASRWDGSLDTVGFWTRKLTNTEMRQFHEARTFAQLG